MQDAISKYIGIQKLKNGNYRFYNTATHDANVYRLLVSSGFRLKRDTGKIIYYQQSANDVVPVLMSDIRKCFLNYLKDTNFYDLPENLEIDRVINWFFEKKRLVREGDHFRGYLEGIYS